MSRFEEMMMAAGLGLFGDVPVIEVHRVARPVPPRRPGYDMDQALQAARRVGYLESENEALQAENERLRRENRALRAELRYSSAVMGAAFSHIEDLEAALDDSDTGEPDEKAEKNGGGCKNCGHSCDGPQAREGAGDGA